MCVGLVTTLRVRCSQFANNNNNNREIFVYFAKESNKKKNRRNIVYNARNVSTPHTHSHSRKIVTVVETLSSAQKAKKLISRNEIHESQYHYYHYHHLYNYYANDISAAYIMWYARQTARRDNTINRNWTSTHQRTPTIDGTERSTDINATVLNGAPTTGNRQQQQQHQLSQQKQTKKLK